MKSYRLDPEKLKEQKRNVILMYGITLVILMVIYYFMYRGQGLSTQTYLMLGLIVVMFLVFGWNALRQRQAIWDQYEIIVDETGIKQKQPKAADIFLPRADITGTKESKFGLTLLAKEGKPVLGVPKMLTPADYEEIKGIVSGWVQNSKPVVLDVEVVEDAQAILPVEELPVEIPEDQQPPEMPEA
jgi:hypothetical protein